MKLPKLTSYILASGLLASSAYGATTLYSEDFEDFSSPPTADRSFSEYGWTAYNTYGTEMSAPANTSYARVANVTDIGGDWRAHIGGGTSSPALWFQTDVTAFNQADHGPLEVSFTHGDNTTTQRYRVAFRVGGSWFLQDNSSVAGTGTGAASFVTSSIGVSASDFAAFTAPTGIFTAPALDLPGSAALPDGEIDGFALLLENKVFADNFRIDDIALTTVPEPSSAALLGLGGLALILRRRK